MNATGMTNKLWTASLAMLLHAAAIGAAELPAPTGNVLLQVTGNIEHTNDGDTANLDLAMLEALPQFSFTTHTPWTDGPMKFTGVRIHDLLNYIGAGSTDFRASASDKYWDELRDMDFENIPAIVAYMRDDKYMRLRDLGPLWIMFPFDEYPELDNEKFKRACVWQLIGIEVL